MGIGNAELKKTMDEGRGKMDDGGQKDFFIKYYNIDGSTRNGIFR